MKQTYRLTCLIEREDDAYVSSCPELDIASQGSSIEESRRNLTEAVQLFLDTADASEVRARMHSEVYMTGIEVAFG
jgi:predicted RNase H-like HicB family nuclease